MFLLGIVVWYNLVIWAAERAYAAMTRGARFQELSPTSWRPRRLTSTSDKKTNKKRRDPRRLFQSALNAYIVYRL